MRRFILCAIILTSILAPLQAQDFKGKPPPKAELSTPNNNFELGERLEYSAEWFGIPVGKIILKNEGVENINGFDCYHISARTFPTGIIKHFYNLEYNTHTYIDTKTLCSRRFFKIRRINSKLNFVNIDFDQEKHKAYFKTWGTTDNIKISPARDTMKIEQTYDIPDHVQDILSTLYCFRLERIEESSQYPVKIYYNLANWSLRFIVGKAYFREVRDKGSFSAVDTTLASDLNDYILGKRKFVITFFADPKRTPYEFRVNSAIGPLRGVLKNIAQQDG